MTLKNNFDISSEIKRVLILGNSGFIGSRLMEFFNRQLRGVEVVGRSMPDIDLTKEIETQKIVGLLDFRTAIIVCAAIKRQWGDNIETFSQNIKIAQNLSQLLQQHPVRRVIFFSSAAVYGEEINNINITEDTPVQPTSFYGIAKYASERLFYKMIKQHKDSSFLVLRPALVYGPGDTSQGYGPSGFLSSALNNEQIVLWGDGTEKREFIFVDDLISLVFALTFYDYDGVLNIVSGTSYSFSDALYIVSGFNPHKLKVISRPRTKEKVDHGFCNSALLNLFPDFAFTGLKEGIRKTIEIEKSLMLEDADRKVK